MADYTINSCKRIVLGGTSPNEIKKVVYCDGYGTAHQVWPGRAELTDVYIVKLGPSQSDDISYKYSVSNGEPNVLILPETDYAIKGTIKLYDAPGNLETTLYDCYFFSETSEPIDQASSGHWTTGTNTSYGIRSAKDSNGNILNAAGDTYGVYKVDDRIGGQIGLEVQLGYVDFDLQFYVQNGFI